MAKIKLEGKTLWNFARSLEQQLRLKYIYRVVHEAFNGLGASMPVRYIADLQCYIKLLTLMLIVVKYKGDDDRRI